MHRNPIKKIIFQAPGAGSYQRVSLYTFFILNVLNNKKNVMDFSFILIRSTAIFGPDLSQQQNLHITQRTEVHIYRFHLHKCK
jgi:hypothetical protein